jgi:preprotein translocase subunit SecE
MGVARYVNMAFIGTGLLAYVVLAELFAWTLMFFGSAANGQVIGHNFRVADLVGLIVAAGLVIWLKRDERVSTFAMEVGNELSKVTWPTWPETKLGTIVVMITTVIIAMILGTFDYLWAAVTSLIYNV